MLIMISRKGGQMNQLQRNIINVYMEKMCNPTLKKISEDTDIQITRVFRILNGSEMKLSEFEKFSSLVSMGPKTIGSLFEDCEIPPADKEQIQKRMNRIEKISKLKKLFLAY